MSVRLLFPLGFSAGLGFALAVPAGAQLSGTSPFMPAGTVGTVAAAEGSPYELRGIMASPQGTRYCIYDPATKTGVWVGLNEKGHSFVVNSADVGHASVSIQVGDGHRLILAMRESKVAMGQSSAAADAERALKVGWSTPQLASQQGTGGAVPSNVVLHPTSESEQARLAAITEEVRRRRLLRDQAQNPPGGAPPGAPPSQ